MTQHELVYNHMRTHGFITSMEAFRAYGITRLAARVSDLRKMGIPVKTTLVTTEDGTHYARYTLGK